MAELKHRLSSMSIFEPMQITDHGVPSNLQTLVEDHLTSNNLGDTPLIEVSPDDVGHLVEGMDIMAPVSTDMQTFSSSPPKMKSPGHFEDDKSDRRRWLPGRQKLTGSEDSSGGRDPCHCSDLLCESAEPTALDASTTETLAQKSTTSIGLTVDTASVDGEKAVNNELSDAGSPADSDSSGLSPQHDGSTAIAPASPVVPGAKDMPAATSCKTPVPTTPVEGICSPVEGICSPVAGSSVEHPIYIPDDAEEECMEGLRSTTSVDQTDPPGEELGTCEHAKKYPGLPTDSRGIQSMSAEDAVSEKWCCRCGRILRQTTSAERVDSLGKTVGRQ